LGQGDHVVLDALEPCLLTIPVLGRHRPGPVHHEKHLHIARQRLWRGARDRRGEADQPQAHHDRSTPDPVQPAAATGGPDLPHRQAQQRQEHQQQHPPGPHHAKRHDRSLHTASRYTPRATTSNRKYVSGRSVMITSASACRSSACCSVISSMMSSTASGSSLAKNNPPLDWTASRNSFFCAAELGVLAPA